MKRRNRIAVMMIFVLLLSFGTHIQAYAQEVDRWEGEIVTPHYEHTKVTGSGVSFVDGVACVYGSVAGYISRTTKINGFLYLQHKIGSDWMIVKTWSGSVNDWCLDLAGEATGLPSGTYRTRFVTYVYEGDESEEVIYISRDVVYKKE